MNFLKNIFSKKIDFKSKFNFEEGKMSEIINQNRKSLDLVNEWIDEDAFKNSFFSYGVPDFIKPHINKPINHSVTYSDLMLYVSRQYFEKINYLEIGVSLGKNFFQMLHGNNGAGFTGFDIEEINPVLEKQLHFKEKTEWTTPADSIKKTNSSLKKFEFNGMDVDYLCADVWDENSWAKLEGNHFNIIFSDALHSPKAILFEFEMLVKYDLLDKKFVIIWDDLVGKMKNSFFKIIEKYDKKYEIEEIYLMNMNGWIGDNEAPHTVGLISNFKLENEGSSH